VPGHLQAHGAEADHPRARRRPVRLRHGSRSRQATFAGSSASSA
jgi:hypothetical protein